MKIYVVTCEVGEYSDTLFYNVRAFKEEAAAVAFKKECEAEQERVRVAGRSLSYSERRKLRSRLDAGVCAEEDYVTYEVDEIELEES